MFEIWWIKVLSMCQSHIFSGWNFEKNWKNKTLSWILASYGVNESHLSFVALLDQFKFSGNLWVIELLDFQDMYHNPHQTSWQQCGNNHTCMILHTHAVVLHKSLNVSATETQKKPIFMFSSNQSNLHQVPFIMLNIEALGRTCFTGIGPTLSSLPCASPYFSKALGHRLTLLHSWILNPSAKYYCTWAGLYWKDCSLFLLLWQTSLLFCTAANVIHQCCSKLCCHLDKEVLLASNLAFFTATRWFCKPIVIQFELEGLECRKRERERERESLREANNKPKCPTRHTFMFDRIGPNPAIFLL